MPRYTSTLTWSLCYFFMFVGQRHLNKTTTNRGLLHPLSWEEILQPEGECFADYYHRRKNIYYFAKVKTIRMNGAPFLKLEKLPRPYRLGLYTKTDHRSYTHNLSSCKIKAWKKFRPERDSNPWPLRYRCSALPTVLSSNWERVTLWVRNVPVDGEECKGIYEISYISTAEKNMKTWLIIAVIQTT